MEYNDIIQKLKSLSDPEAVKGMARFGINPENTYGVSIPNLRKMAKETGVNHDLAQRLWESNIHEARILASMIDDPKMVAEEQGRSAPDAEVAHLFAVVNALLAYTFTKLGVLVFPNIFHCLKNISSSGVSLLIDKSIYSITDGNLG